MDYMTLKGAAEKVGAWHLVGQIIIVLVDDIPGAVKMAGVWLIPKAAEKPIDGRTKQGRLLKHE